jgi:uncharacterized phiE125 gp8 family phage protein
MGMKLITAATAEPITLAELKQQCRVDTSDEDDVLNMAIAAARAKCENYTRRALVNQTWEQTLDEFPDAEIELLKPPVSSITSVTYIDANGTVQTLSNSLYTLDNATYPAWLLPAYDTSWPDTRDTANAVTVRYVCGYGADGTAVPSDIRMWLLMTASFVFSQREAFVVGGKIAEIPSRFIDSLLDPYVVLKA